MITIKTNIGRVMSVNITALRNLSENDKMLRTVATSVLDLMKKRIHTDGKDATGNQIGTYSKGYMVVRTGSFQNAAKVSRGKNLGKLKDAGSITKGSNTGASRPKYNRSSDTKVILSLTRQMENDMKVISLKTGSYGIGFSNKLNYDKSQWCEKTYKKEGKIYALSNEEVDAANLIVENFVKDAVS
jgi:hypothetical protein